MDFSDIDFFNIFTISFMFYYFYSILEKLLSENRNISFYWLSYCLYFSAIIFVLHFRLNLGIAL